MDKVTEHLIEGCRRGDRSSQLKLHKQYAQRLYIACLRIVEYLRAKRKLLDIIAAN